MKLFTSSKNKNFAGAMAQLKGLGFTNQQALLGLLLNNHNVESAVRFLRDQDNAHLLVSVSYEGLRVQVQLARLQHATFLNGLKGTIVGFEEHTDRFLVDVSQNLNQGIEQLSMASTDVVRSVKAENIDLILDSVQKQDATYYKEKMKKSVFGLRKKAFTETSRISTSINAKVQDWKEKRKTSKEQTDLKKQQNWNENQGNNKVNSKRSVTNWGTGASGMRLGGGPGATENSIPDFIINYEGPQIGVAQPQQGQTQNQSQNQNSNQNQNQVQQPQYNQAQSSASGAVNTNSNINNPGVQPQNGSMNQQYQQQQQMRYNQFQNQQQQWRNFQTMQHQQLQQQMLQMQQQKQIQMQQMMAQNMGKNMDNNYFQAPQQYASGQGQAKQHQNQQQNLNQVQLQHQLQSQQGGAQQAAQGGFTYKKQMDMLQRSNSASEKSSSILGEGDPLGLLGVSTHSTGIGLGSSGSSGSAGQNANGWDQ